MADQYLSNIEIKFLRDAQHDIEYKSSRFWQYFLQRRFSQNENYAVVCEQAPDDSRRRVDISVLRYDPDHDTLSAMVFVEVKRAGGSLKTLEDQGLDAAKRAIDEDGLVAVYIVTAWGLKYRAWYVSAERRALEPMYESDERSRKDGYLEVDSEEGISELLETIRLIKGDPPLRQAPVIPSQQLELEQMLQGGSYHTFDQTPSAYGYGGGQDISVDYGTNVDVLEQDMPDYMSSANQGVQAPEAMSLDDCSNMNRQDQPSMDTSSTYQETKVPEAMSVDQAAVEFSEDSGTEAGPSQAKPGSKGKGKGKEGEKVSKEVKVSRIPHKFKKDELEFQDRRNKTRTTVEDEWVKKRRDGHNAFEYRYKGVVYWCKKLP